MVAVVEWEASELKEVSVHLEDLVVWVALAIKEVLVEREVSVV